MYQQPADVAVPALAYAQHLGSSSRGILLRNQPKRGRHVTSFPKLLTIAGGCKQRCSRQRAYSRYRHQPTSGLIPCRQSLDLPCDLSDPLLQSPEVLKKLSEEAP